MSGGEGEYNGERTVLAIAYLLVELYSCKTKYALLALLELAGVYQQAEPLQIAQIAERQQIPDRYLEQILATLRRAGIIKSQRGAKGGYLLAKDPNQVSVFDTITILEGGELPYPLDSPATLESAITQELWQEIHQQAHSLLQSYTLQDLCDRRNARQQLEIMYYI
jgi:Rrf2 family protein